MTYTFRIPFVGHHSSIVNGKGGSTIKKLMGETGCFIKAENANVSEGRPLPFFHIEGLNEKMVNQAALQIQSMLMTSMMRNEKSLKSQNEEMTRQTNFLEMKVVDQDVDQDVDQGVDQDVDDGTGDEKDVLIDSLTSKLAEKDQQIASLITTLDEKADWIDSLTSKLAEKDQQLSSLLDISKDPITSITSLQCSSNDTQEAQHGHITLQMWLKRSTMHTHSSQQSFSAPSISSSQPPMSCTPVFAACEESDDDSEEEAEEPISVDIGPPKQTLVNNLKVKGKDPCAKSVCTGSPICCNCCENRCCRCSRSKEWSKFPSGHMVPPKWDNLEQ